MRSNAGDGLDPPSFSTSMIHDSDALDNTGKLELGKVGACGDTDAIIAKVEAATKNLREFDELETQLKTAVVKMEEDRLTSNVEQRDVYESQMTSLWTEVTHEDLQNGDRDSEVEEEEGSSDSTSDTSCTLDSDEDSTSLTDTCDEEDADDIPEAAAVSASGSNSKESMYSDDYERQQLLAWQQQLRHLIPNSTTN